MKFTICVTQHCNLACAYCYIGKNTETMPLDTARRVVDFIYARALPDEKLEVGFFGGEPLLAFDRLRDIVALLEEHPAYDPAIVEMTVVSNGTIFTDGIAAFLLEHGIALGVSCDGPPDVQNLFRRGTDGSETSRRVEFTLRQIADCLPFPMVNAVYHPRTFQSLPRTVRYFSTLGLRRIYLNPDFSAPWRPAEAELLPRLMDDIADFFVDRFRAGDPHFISFLNGKMGVMMRGGYPPEGRCRMGRAEFAFSAMGYVYPCERLLGDGRGGPHCIGHVTTGIDVSRMACHSATAADESAPCRDCGVREYCMNWCGCSNFMSSRSYNAPGAFLCASERASIGAAATVIDVLSGCGLGPQLFAYLFGEQEAAAYEAVRLEGGEGDADAARMTS
jgi:uncharacterized protein